MSRPVSGILSAVALPVRRGGHPSERSTWGDRTGRPSHDLTLLRVGFAEPPGSPRALVRSYRTVSPLPVRLTPPSAVCSLWHCPAGHPDWVLPSTDEAVRSYRTVSPLPPCGGGLSFLWHFPASHLDWPLASTLPCGVPTFLDQVAGVSATAWPRPPGQLTVAVHCRAATAPVAPWWRAPSEGSRHRRRT